MDNLYEGIDPETLTELEEIGVFIPQSQRLNKQQVKEKVVEILTIESEKELGRRLWDFACLVDFDYEALRPLLERSPQFISEVENFTHMEFYALRAQIQYSQETVRLLRRIAGVPITIPEGIVEELREEWAKDTKRNWTRLPTEPTETLKGDKEEVIRDEGKSNNALDLDSLLK